MYAAGKGRPYLGRYRLNEGGRSDIIAKTIHLARDAEDGATEATMRNRLEQST